MKDYNACSNEENFPDGTVKAQDGKCFLMVNGKWEQIVEPVGVNLPESPIPCSMWQIERYYCK